MTKKDLIIKAVTRHYQLNIDQINHRTRRWEILIARQTLQYLLVKYGDCSQREAGEITGYTKAAVKKAIKTVNNLKDTDKKYKNDLTKIILVIQEIDLVDFCQSIIQDTDNKEIIHKAQLIIDTL